MKKINITLTILSSLLFISAINSQITVLPYIESFEALTNCSVTCGVNCDLPGNTALPLLNLTNERSDDIDWVVSNGGTTTPQTGPSVDHTLGSSVGKYLYIESSCNSIGFPNKEAVLLSPVFDFTGKSLISVQFWYHMLGVQQGTMSLDVSFDGGASWMDDFFVPAWSDDLNEWQERCVTDPALDGANNVRFRIRGVTGTSFVSDMAIDDFKVSEVGSLADFLLTPVNSELCYSTPTDVALSFNLINDLCSSVYGGGPMRFELFSDNVLIADEMIDPGMLSSGNSTTITFGSTINLVPNTNYNIKAIVSSISDLNTLNDTLEYVQKVWQSIITYPYEEDFEAGQGGWTIDPTSINSTWGFGLPQLSDINQAASGVNAWATGNLNSTYNNNESSSIVSPCFDFSNLCTPEIQLSIWWSTEFSYDGAVLQSSTDGKNSWQTVGGVGDPENWYTDGMIDGMPGGQNAGWSGDGVQGSNGYLTAKHLLNSLRGESNVFLRIAFGSDFRNRRTGFAFDDIKIVEKYSLIASDVCLIPATVSNLSGGYPNGGIYSGPGVSDDGNGMTYTVTPSNAGGAGTYTLTYTVSGCNAITDDFVISNPPNLIFDPIGNICINAGIQSNLGGVLPIGGVYSGPGIVDNGDGTTFTINPSMVGLGTYTVDYTYNLLSGCSTSISSMLSVVNVPSVSFTALPDLCMSAAVQTGLSGGSPTGGIYSGLGVTDDGNGLTYSFNPNLAVVGINTLTYTYTDALGCSFIAADNVTIVPRPTVTFTALPDVCINEGLQSGLGGGLPAQGTAMGDNGIYNGPGVFDGADGLTYSFSPSIAGEGVHTISYTYTDENGCVNTATDEVEVLALPDISIPFFEKYCINSGVVSGIEGITPIGGVYSATGVTDDGNGSTFTMDPSILGIGIQVVTYDYTHTNSCVVSITFNLEVVDIPIVDVTAPVSMCLNAGIQTGLGGGTPVKGSVAGDIGFYSGPGITDNGNGLTYNIDPQSAGPGLHPITYSYTNENNCVVTSTENFEIFNLVPVTFTAPNDLCIDAGSQSMLSGGMPIGGIYSGPGVTDGGAIDDNYTFDPISAGVGIHTITYTFTDINGCVNSASDDIEVFDLPILSFTAINDLCLNLGAQTGSGSGMPVGGIYSGPSITDDGNGLSYSFDPSTAGAGIHTITYTFTDANFCTNLITDDVEVFEVPMVTFAAINDLCLNLGAQTGSGSGMPVGGIYSGPSITDDGNGLSYSFDPMAAGVGIHTVQYMYTDENGCTETANDNVEVFDVPMVSFTAINDLCLNAGPQTGSGSGMPNGGIYSGPGVTDDSNGLSYVFDPNAAGVGVHTLTYTYTDANSCTSSLDDDIEVFAVPIVTLDNPGNFCIDAGVQSALTGGLPAQGTEATDNGVYSGPGVTDNGDGLTYTFDPLTAGEGTHVIMYLYTDSNSCSESSTTSIEVFASPLAMTGSYGPVCENDDDLILTGSPLPSAGEFGMWSGMGVTDIDNGDALATFDFTGLTGTVTLSYTFTSINGCSNTSTTDVIINEIPVLAPSSNEICPNSGSVLNLFANATSMSGQLTFSWVGPNGQMSNEENPTFSPTTASDGGLWTVTVTDDINGCSNSASITVEFLPETVLTISDCACDYDSDFNNYGSQVTITLNGGLAPYSVSTSYGSLSETTLVDNQPSILKLGQDGGSYTLTITDANGCVTTRNSSCGGCDFVFEITDPCACNNDQSFNGAQDGTFDEVVEVTGATGLDLIVGAGSIGMNGINVGDSFTEELPGVYRLRFDHVDLIGYTIFVEGRFGNITFPVLDSNGNQVSAINACQYPVVSEPQLDQDDFCFNGAPLVFTGNEVSEINGFAGDVQVYLGNVIGGSPISEFDPNLYSSGLYTLTFLFIGDFVDNIGGSTADPAFPGCQTITTIQVGVNGGEALVCNDHLNMTVNTNCELDFSFYALLESGSVPNIFDAEFYTSSGEEIDENELGSHAGSVISYSIFDLCNGNSCWGTINIEDKTDPEINCEICPVIDGTNAMAYDPECIITCYEQPILQLKYDAKLRDKLVPEDIEDFVAGAMSDNCDNWNDNEVSYIDKYEDLGDCFGARLTRTWTVGFDKSDGSKGSVSCSRQYFVNPLSLSTITEYEKDEFTGKPIIRPIKDSLVLPPDLIVLPCGEDISPEGLVAYFDNPLTLDLDSNDNNVDPDEWDVDLIVENNEGYAWAYPHYYMHGVGSGGPHAQKITNEICTIISGYTDTEIDACNPGCDGNKKILREWVILDWCNSELIEHSQIIKSIDTNEPTITVEDITLSVDPWTCTVDAKLPMPDHIIDDCANITTYYLGFTGGYEVIGDSLIGYTILGLPLGTHTIEYLAEDCCGNVGSTTMLVEVVDLTPPVAVSKEFIVISLTNLGNPIDEFQGIAKIYAKDVDNGSYDGCSAVTLEIRRSPVCKAEDAEWGPFVSFCCEDLQGATSVNIDVELKITDINGNFNLVWSTIILEDKSSGVPVIPPHMYLTCDMDFNDFDFTGGLPRVYGACGEAQVSCDTATVIANTEPRELRLSDGVYIEGVLQEAPAYDPACGYGAIRRQFKDCGNGVQWFVILQVDPFDPSSIVFPNDTVVDCDNYDLDKPSWELATCGLIGVSLEADTFAFEDGACFKILNHWTIINWCAYDPTDLSGRGKFEHTQIVKIVDTQDPVLTVIDSLCFAVDIDCTSKGVVMSGSAIDAGDCGSKWLSWQVSIDINADWTEDYNYASTNPRRLNNGDLNPFHLPKTGNGEDVYLELPDGIPNSKIWHRSIWRAYDGCGNTVSVSRYFQVSDKKAPTPYCLNLSTAVMTNGEVELWAIDFNVGSFDNCSNSENLLYTFTDVAPPSRKDEEYNSNDDLLWYDGSYWYYNSEQIDPLTGAGEYETQDDFGGAVHKWEPGIRSSGAVFTAADAGTNGFLELPIYVWDECGNYDFCLVNLRIADNGGGMAMVSGHVVTELGEEVDQVLTNLKGPANFIKTDMTDVTGIYAFPNTPLYDDYLVSGTKTDDYLNGVSTLDLVLIQRHILGQTYLDTPYKMIAADINKDNQITTLDLLELRKLLLGIFNELPNNGSWTLVDSDNNLTVENPWNYDESILISDLNQDMYTEDFIGVKIGDVNGNVIANAQSTGIVSRSNSIDINYEDKIVGKGDVVELTLTTDRTDVYGYQFTLNTPGLELTEVVGNVKSDNIGVFNNRLTVSYNANEMITSDNLLTLRLKVNQAGQLSEMLTMGSEVTQAEAYVGNNLEVVNIDLRVNTAATFELFQNEPNPFNEYTVIGFNMPKSGEATLRMYDVTGKTLKVIKGNYAQGYNSVRISKDDLGVAGMVYYKLQTGEFTATKHMVVIQ